MTGDGIDDMLTGSYNPGIVTMFEGTKNGFKPGVELEQEGDPRKWAHGLSPLNSKSFDYWNYTSVGKGDFDGDGLIDLFIGGNGGIRVSKNIGTKTNPRFGKRELLLDPKGNALTLKEVTEEAIKKSLSYGYPTPSGDMKSHIHPIDWDNDGVLDLLITSSYCYKGQNPVEFFRGVKTDKGIRFEQRKPLFTAENGKKVFPGSCPLVSVVDYNNDGIKDLLWGLSIPTVNGYQMSERHAWIPERDGQNIEQPGKDKGRHLKGLSIDEYISKEKKRYEEMKKKFPGVYKPKFIDKELTNEERENLTLRHRGYIYVMLGKENNKKAESKTVKAEDYKMPEYYKEATNTVASKGKGPVKYDISAVISGNFQKSLSVKVNFKLAKGWYLYADTEGNKKSGYMITKVKINAPKGFKSIGDIEIPVIKSSHGADVYMGDDVVFTQVYGLSYRVRPGKYKLQAEIFYQTCNESGCMAPVKEKTVIVVEVKGMR